MAGGLATGLSPSLRLDQQPEAVNDDQPVHVDIQDEDDGTGDHEVTDDKGNILRIEHADGTITISTDGAPLNPDSDEDKEPKGWFDNLVMGVNEMELGILADDLLRGYEDDLISRQDWIDQRTDGMKLLGLKLETPNTGDSADGAAVEGMSRVRHPMMLMAVLNFQANFRGEFLPVDGPCKVRDDDNNDTNEKDELADCLERDMNHFLTVEATEFYPDTDRMAFELGFSGLGIKKVYFCPMRNRPVSEMVDTDDLIVNNSATDLGNALRITHRIDMRPSVVKRMQLLGIYRDVPLGDPMPATSDSLKNEKKEQQGITTGSLRPEDRDREILEIYCERDIKDYEHKWKGKPSGLPLPWRVTIDKSSRKVLSLVRNYDQPEEPNDLPVSNIGETFIDYGFVPGFGFYPIGLLHIMGNMTNAATAAWREMLDMGMFANFPGFLFAKQAGRQNSLIFRVPPGGGAPIDTGGAPIQQTVMPLPYTTQGMPALFQLQQDITQQGEKAGATSQVAVAEGRADVPVGTTLAMIEEAQKMVSAVHKRNHTSQSRELQAIAKCFKRHPESFWQCNKKPARKWDAETFLKALKDCNLVPQSDPNTASHVQRMMKVQALGQLNEKLPGIGDPIKLYKIAARSIGYSNPESFMVPPEALGKPPPELAEAQAKTANDGKKADAAMLSAQTNAKKADAEMQDKQHAQGLATGQFQLTQQNSDIDNKVKIADTQLKHAIGAAKLDQDQDKNLVAEEVQLVDAAQNLTVHPESAALVAPLIQPAFEDVKRRQAEHREKRGTGLGVPMPGQPDQQ